MRAIPRTSLACADCLHPGLALRAMERSLAQCAYEDAIFFTDAHVDPPPRGVRVVPIARLADSHAYSRFILQDLVAHVATDFVQLVQWDGYVVNGAAWRDDFLDYDYIGARWWFRPEGSNVGNGGFSLRSRRLLEAAATVVAADTDAEDVAICIRHRPALEERHGIRFAPGDVADRYAFEGEDPSGREFGFHRMFNLPYFNDAQELAGILDALDDASFCNPGAVTLVEKLARMGRRRECARQALRLAACRDYVMLPAQFRAALRQVMAGLAPRLAPCPCGQGKVFARCCGDPARW